eukprot:scaffold184098_cov38-Tisochrysis_lutea.AAC.1
MPDGAISPLLDSLLHSASLVGALLGTLSTFAVATRLGRRRELVCGATFYALGSIGVIFSPARPPAAIALIIAGRTVYGLGIALSMHAAPVYISEVTPSRVRGLFVSLKEAFIVLGIMTGFAAAVVFVGPTAWRWIWSIPIPIAVIVLFGMLLLPPSPRWLLHRAQMKLMERSRAQDVIVDAEIDTSRAMSALIRFRSRSPRRLVESEIRSILVVLQEEGGRPFTWGSLCRARKALLAGLGLVLLQQITGQPSVLYYQNDILDQVGFGRHAAIASFFVSSAKLAATMFTVFKVDSYGRRPLLKVGICMMLVALLIIGVGFQLAQPGLKPGTVRLPDAVPGAVLLALVLYVMGYQIGFGPITWVMIAEVFPLSSRGPALSLATTVNFAFNLLTTISLSPMMAAFESLQPGRGSSLLFFLYAFFCALSLIFVQVCVPETKGKTLEEIEQALR